MDQESSQAAALLQETAACNERFIDMARRLRTRPGVTTVQHQIDFRVYSSGPIIEGYVDAELDCDIGLAWWLEITWDVNIWRIRYGVSCAHAKGQDAVQTFPDLVTDNVTGLIDKLRVAVNHLEAACESIPLSGTALRPDDG